VTDFTDTQGDTHRVAATLLHRLEQFYDAVPRLGADAEPHGPLTLFVRRGAGWPYYARPTLGHPGPVTVSDITAMRARQRSLGVPEALEWVLETSPSVDASAVAAGLLVRRCPLLVLTGPPAAVPVPAGVAVGGVRGDAPDLARIDAVAAVGFGLPGTASGTAGPAARDATAAEVDAARLAALRARLDSGQLVQAVATGAEGPLAVGSYQHAGGVAEIVGVATLPSARRRGLAAAVSAELARHALAAGMTTVFLSAGDDAAARVYERVGFRRVATAGIAEPPGP
jgi:ribosomal protein S18 acetylase RimI-like enzyme